MQIAKHGFTDPPGNASAAYLAFRTLFGSGGNVLAQNVLTHGVVFNLAGCEFCNTSQHFGVYGKCREFLILKGPSPDVAKCKETVATLDAHAATLSEFR